MTEEAFRNIGHVIKHRGTDPRYKDRLFMYFEDERLTFGDYLSSCIRYANLFLKVKTEKKPDCFNVGVLMQNYPEFMISLGACALAGATLSGINTGQKGLMLARDINFTDCILLITDNMFLPEVEAVIDDLSLIDRKNVVVNNIRDEDKSLPHGYTSLDNKLTETEAVMGTRAFNTAPDIDVDPETNLMIIFTSGTTGSPKGIINSHQKLMGMSAGLIAGLNFSDNDVAYGVMPHFHSNSVYLAYIPAIMCAGGFAFRRKFSASGSHWPISWPPPRTLSTMTTGCVWPSATVLPPWNRTLSASDSGWIGSWRFSVPPKAGPPSSACRATLTVRSGSWPRI
jgi:fatty-acyl-CoA synthase